MSDFGVGTRSFTRDRGRGAAGGIGAVLDSEPTGFFFEADGARVNRMADRLFLAEATAHDGSSLGGGAGADWFSAGTGVAAGLSWVNFTATVALVTTLGTVGFAAASRASDVPSDLGTSQISIPFVGIAIMDRTGGGPPFWTAYGAYLEGRIEGTSNTTGTVIGLEIDAINFGSAVGPSRPSQLQLLGGATALWLASGGDPGNHGRSIGPAQLAIGIVDNGETFETGIVFAATAIEGTDGTTGFGPAIRMATRQYIDWWAPGAGPAYGLQTTFITSTATVAVNSLQFQDNATLLVTPAGQIAFAVGNVAGSVNGIGTTPAATTVAPSLDAFGTDTNVDLALKPKGTGTVHLYTPTLFFYSTGGNQLAYVQTSVTDPAAANGLTFSDNGAFFFGRGATSFSITQQASAVNHLDVRNAVTTAPPGLFASGTDTNIGMVVQPKGTGAFMLQLPTGSAAGGNTRGANAVDLQTSRLSGAQVASGNNSVILGGRSNSAISADGIAGGSNAQSSNTGAIALGNFVVASGTRAIAMGDTVTTSNTGGVALGSNLSATGARTAVFGQHTDDRGRHGTLVFASGRQASNGDRQAVVAAVLRGTTTDGSTGVRLTGDGAAVGALNSLSLANNSAMRFRILLVAQQVGTACKEWLVEGLIQRDANAASTSMPTAATITSTFGDASLSAASVACTADTTLGNVNLTVTGVAATTMQWTAFVQAAEVAG
jgi:hypothetical protein